MFNLSSLSILVPPPYRECLFEVHVLQIGTTGAKIVNPNIVHTAARLCLVALTTVAYLAMQSDIILNPAPLVLCAFMSTPAAIVTGANLLIGKAVTVRIIGGIAANSFLQIATGIAGVAIGWFMLKYHDWRYLKQGIIEDYHRKNLRGLLSASTPATH